jgi:hypothetical protein
MEVPMFDREGYSNIAEETAGVSCFQELHN